MTGIPMRGAAASEPRTTTSLHHERTAIGGVFTKTKVWRAAWWCRRLLDLPVHPRLIAAALLAVVVALNLYAPAQPTLLQRALASLLVGLCAVPSFMWACNRHWPHALLPHAGVLYAACFALPVFLLPTFTGHWWSHPPLDRAVGGALMLATGGWAALLIGHFVAPAGWLTRILPRVEVAPGSLHARGTASRAARSRAAPAEGSLHARGAPSRSPAEGSFHARGAASRSPAEGSFAKAIAAAAACIGVPCFYLDNAAVLAHYNGQTLLPDAVAFPVAFAGQAVVFAVLALFHLHLRGQLGVAGRVCVIALTAYYTLLGFSTGMANHGLKALFGLFAAYAVVVRQPTWRYMVWGALVAAVLLLVVVPGRYHYRQLVWTHGTEPAGAPPGRGHEFQWQGSALEQVVDTPAYSVTLKGRALTFVHRDPTVCRKRAQLIDFLVFVHVHPVDLNDLAYRRRPYGFDQLGFNFANGRVEGRQCVYRGTLPDYAIQVVRVGLYRFATPPTHPTYLPGRVRLAAPASDMAAEVDSRGEWHLATRNASTWQIVPSSPALSRLRVVMADEAERRQIAMIGANNRIRVEVDERNWAEYVVSGVRISGQLATLRLSELRRLQGDPSALRDGAAATLRYEQAGPIAAALPWPGQVPGEGSNPAAPQASRSLANTAVIYAKSLLPAAFIAGVDATKTVQRFDRLLAVTWIMVNTPARVPYLQGETLRPLLYKLVPRAIYKNKPEDNPSLIDQRYGFVLPEESTKHFKVHQLGELYANFGAAGTIAGMLVLGLLLRIIHDLFHHASASAATMAAGTHMLMVLVLEMESLLSVSWGFVAWYSVALLALAAASRVGQRWFGRRGGEVPET